MRLPQCDLCIKTGSYDKYFAVSLMGREGGVK